MINRKIPRLRRTPRDNPPVDAHVNDESAKLPCGCRTPREHAYRQHPNALHPCIHDVSEEQNAQQRDHETRLPPEVTIARRFIPIGVGIHTGGGRVPEQAEGGVGGVGAQTWAFSNVGHPPVQPRRIFNGNILETPSPNSIVAACGCGCGCYVRLEVDAILHAVARQILIAQDDWEEHDVCDCCRAGGLHTLDCEWVRRNQSDVPQ